MSGYRYGGGHNPHDSRRYMDWLARAKTDIDTMSLLIEHGGDPATAIFHGHQAMEKSFKGYLLFAARQHADGHNLTWLCRQALKIDGAFAMFLPDCARMSRSYIETRYPTDLPLRIDVRQPDAVMSVAQKLYGHIISRVTPELT
ncbi:MAG: HEPN domain-containing protein [Oscillospiraceae bacterium]|nr:HEPN domain-containing protein [Oscillospiraceae bacterium]